MDKTLFDRTTGEVVIREGSIEPENSRAGGFFTVGGGNGLSGGAGGSSRKRAKKRARAKAAAIAKKRAEAQAAAEAVRQVELAAQVAAKAAIHRQWVEHFSQAQQSTRAAIDQHFSTQAGRVEQAVSAELAAVRKHAPSDGSERWQLHLITRERVAVEDLIAAKTALLQQKLQQAQSFGGQDPLRLSPQDYADRLASQDSSPAFQKLHQAWETAYTAAHEAQILSEAIRTLTDQSSALSARHAEQTIVWRAREELLEQQRQYAQLREARIQYKQLADENLRLKRIRQANTLSAPVSAATGSLVMTWDGVRVAEGAAGAIGQAIADAVQELGRVAAIRTGQTASLFVTAATYSSELGNGELSVEQRRHLQALGIPADLLGIRQEPNLREVADAGGSVEVDYRVKLEAHQGTTAIVVTSSGDDIPSRVPVRNAAFDSQTNTYRAEGLSVTDRDLVFTSDVAMVGTPDQGGQVQSGLLSMEMTAVPVPAGVDTRISDCIVCIPGMAPLYFSFSVPPLGSGVVSGGGQAATSGWWQATTSNSGAAIPSQVASTLRGREFASFAGFERSLWRAIGEEAAPGGGFSEVNQRRIANGLAPYAPRSNWMGERRTFEIRYPQAAALGHAPYDLDLLGLHTPDSICGVRSEVQSFTPWLQPGEPISLEAARSLAHASGGRRTWIPLVPPGQDLLGTPALPLTPPLPGSYPGEALDPLRPQIETLPGLDSTESGTTIPGYGADTDLPSPGLVFAEPLDVGPYDELGRRSVRDGLDIDHIVSRKALELYIRRELRHFSVEEIRSALSKAPSIAIPAHVHRKFSETYGGNNTKDKQYEDSLNLKGAVDSNIDALKPGLLEYGLKEADIELAREKIHTLNKIQGWYE